MDLNKHRGLMEAFITLQFSNYLLKWMFHSRKLNNKINGRHERVPNQFIRTIGAFLNFLLIYTIL